MVSFASAVRAAAARAWPFSTDKRAPHLSYHDDIFPIRIGGMVVLPYVRVNSGIVGV